MRYFYKDNRVNRSLDRVGKEYFKGITATVAQTGGNDTIVSLAPWSRPIQNPPSKNSIFPPSNIVKMIETLKPYLTESTQNVIHYMEINQRKAVGRRGAEQASTETLGDRWMEYARLTKDPMRKSMATQVGNWYQEKAKILDEPI
jgi:hypothetical protein